MSVYLGKRKRPRAAPAKPTRSDSVSSNASTDSDSMRRAFARAFEANFAPLEGSSTRQTPEQTQDIEDLRSDDSRSDYDSDASSGSSFSGFDTDSSSSPAKPNNNDNNNEDTSVQIITHTSASRAPTALSKAELKAFMSPRVPRLSAFTTPSTTSKRTSNSKAPHPQADDQDDAPTEALNLKHDLALQRLISESHLLAPASQHQQPAKNQRQRIADVRLQSLGAPTSLLAQDKMPMAQRKGIAAKKRQREELRRSEAKENGIILEKARVEKTRREADEGQRKRERGIGGPSVGRFKGGTLQLSKRDLGAIKGPSRGRGRGGGRGGRGGKRR